MSSTHRSKYLKSLDRFVAGLRRGTLGFRLTVGYATLFSVSVLVLFLLAYILLVSFMRQKDHDFLQSELHEYAAAYASGGLDLVEWEVESRAGYSRHTPIMVRVADADNRTLYLHAPEAIDGSGFEWLEQQLPPGSNEWIHRNMGDDDEFEVGTRRLPAGAILQVGMSVHARGELLKTFRFTFALVTIPVLILGLLGGALQSYRALRPLRHLVGTLQEITRTGEFDERVPTPSTRGEFAELVRMFNGMMDNVQSLLFGMRQTLDDVAHDLRTPMTHLRGKAELALSGGGGDIPELRDALMDSVEASDSILTMLNTLMDVSEAESGAITLHPENIAVDTLVEDVLDLYEFVADEKRITLRSEVADDVLVVADSNRLRRVLANLLDNAIKYTDEGGAVTVRAEQVRDGVAIGVVDTGEGIPDEEQSQIWDRLYRGDRSRSKRGLGLGLSLVKAIVEAHGGRVSVTSSPGHGSTFTIVLPRPGTDGMFSGAAAHKVPRQSGSFVEAGTVSADALQPDHITNL